MPTNIGAIVARAAPLRIVTRSNSDWRDAFPFEVAGRAAGYPSPGNAGTGALVVASVLPQTPLGAHEVQIVEAAPGEPARFTVHSPAQRLTAIGRVGVEIYAGGVTFTLQPGSAAYAVGDTLTLGVMPVALDVTGIRFDLMLRVLADRAGVALAASTRDGTIVNGGLHGSASMRVPRFAMQGVPPGPYAYDLLARADGIEIVPYHGTVDHDVGVTRGTV